MSVSVFIIIVKKGGMKMSYSDIKKVLEDNMESCPGHELSVIRDALLSLFIVVDGFVQKEEEKKGA